MQQAEFTYLSASEVLKWADLNTDAKNKKVENISLTQNRLIAGLISSVKNQNHYLLDGHYCLFDKDGNVMRIPFVTFESINPISLHLIIGDVDKIKLRIEERDQRSYDIAILKNMQEQEMAYSKELSARLNVKLSIGKEGDYSEILGALKTVNYIVKQ